MKRSATPIGVVFALCGLAHGQDSVALAPGGNDSLSAYASQSSRYVVDLVPLFSSWGHEFVIGPVVKASRGVSPGERAARPMGLALSRDARLAVNFAMRDYAFWMARGQGVHPTENALSGVVSTSAFDEQYALTFTDLSAAGATNVVGALIGWRDEEPDRLWVERRLAASSRSSAGALDNSTLSTGACDADGAIHLRADAFNTSAANAQRVRAENIVRVQAASRSGAVNLLSWTGATNAASDAAATSFFLNNSTTTTNPPTAMPASVAASAIGAPLTLNFAGQFRFGSNGATTAHLAPGVEAHRGNPSYATLTLLGQGGALAALGCTDAPSGQADALNAWGITTAGAVNATVGAVIPPILADGPFVATGARFMQHMNQTAFRGGVGHVGLGRDGMDLILAATATDSIEGEFIAAARFPAPVGMSAPVWSIVARVGAAVLDGENGATIGLIAEGSMVGSLATFSAPAGDSLGNLYFIAPYKPTLLPARRAFFKAVNTPSGHRLERVLEEGQVVVGANSTRPFVVRSLALGDSDSLSSESFFPDALLRARRPGSGSNPASPDAFGGAIVSAVIEYDNVAVVESYRAVLFIGPKGLDGLVGDINMDGVVDTADLGLLLGAFGTADAGADLNGDGIVDTADLGLLLLHFGQTSGP